MEQNPVCSMLGITYPVIQGGMAWVADAELAAAVSNAGGLGLIAAMNSNGEQLREQIVKARTLTDRPFGVNLMLMSPFIEEAVSVVCEEGVKVVTTGAGNPAKYMDRLKEAGVKVICVVAGVALAVMAERMGACAVVAEGCESGGHVGETTTMALVPQVVDAVSIPVIAAGGIADGRGMAAAFLLGAQGIQMGTRFLTAKECTIHPNYKAKVIAANDHDTVVTGKTLGHPVRALKNRMTREFQKKEADPNTTPDELQAMGAGALRRAAREGDVQYGSCMCGQIAGLVKTEDSCADIVRGICEDAKKQLALVTGRM
ncbi:MAG: enoyl-[acyl-carrier-protein] reductase FabK [Lachnospiraceae bacterium]|nr:enoyl-[acyl-carrier-protein] reductase FabK [Lachnospiraceae bacterium]MBO4668715.1 enoyl-[acyl-carrier-protein] reductase FabK [Lachnospiraceae bacterium]MBR5666084.1 enoyl-[acyl-carrier-protein] reductase FabK [Lachnospiraceae bacterium]